MCGICCTVSLSSTHKLLKSICSPIDKEHLERLKHRGPDSFSEETVLFDDKASLSFYSSVLHLRGSHVVTQPYKDEKGNLLLWNGEILGGQMAKEIHEGESDTEYLSSTLSSHQNVIDFLAVFERIHGPWAFIYWQVEKGLLWFGRDILGRRSLLYSTSQDPDLCFNLSSLASSTAMWNEVPADGIYCLDISRSKAEGCLMIFKYGWSKSASGRTLNPSECSFCESAQCRIIVANQLMEPPIRSPLNTLISSECSGLVNNSLNKTTGDELFQFLLQKEAVQNTVNEFEELLGSAVKSRVENQPFLCKDCLWNSVVHQTGSAHCSVDSGQMCKTTCNHSSVGVLFSGGIDSLIIAALAHRFVPADMPIDLINVAFHCPNKKKNQRNTAKEGTDYSYDVPDRITGKQGTQALKNLHPIRQWNFIEVNVSQEELEKIRSQHICHILKPSCTVLDDSIGCACWFAARGRGHLDIGGRYREYTSPARVLLLGMGADEQLAGYIRHRARFRSNGWNGLNEELSLELDRLSSRNLGRDDRIISDNGREARYPFLDEKVVSFLNEKPIWLKANLNFPRGVGEKLVLRLLTYRIGLKEAAVLPKRAIQFGSRIARSENNHEKGSDCCQRLLQINCGE